MTTPSIGCKFNPDMTVKLITKRNNSESNECMIINLFLKEAANVIPTSILLNIFFFLLNKES